MYTQSLKDDLNKCFMIHFSITIWVQCCDLFSLYIVKCEIPRAEASSGIRRWCFWSAGACVRTLPYLSLVHPPARSLSLSLCGSRLRWLRLQSSVSVSRSPPPAAGVAPPPVGRHVLYLVSSSPLAPSSSLTPRSGFRESVGTEPVRLLYLQLSRRATRHDCNRVIAPTDCLQKGKCALGLFSTL
jgi:hypothetical protein